MIPDELLQTAAAQANQALCGALPPASACGHRFSPQFERRMKRLLLRAKRPAAYRYLHRAASFLVALLLAGTLWLTVDTKARAAFLDWVRRQYHSFVEYRFVGERPEEDRTARYAPAWLPEGYAAEPIQQTEGMSVRVYRDGEGQALYFICSQGADAASLFVAAESAAAEPAVVGALSADFYRAADPQDASVLVWQSEAGDLLFSLSGALEKSDLVRIAESVTEE